MGVCLQNHGVETRLRQLHFFEKQLASAFVVLVEKDQVHGYHCAEKGDGFQKTGMPEKVGKRKCRKDDAGQDDIADELPFFLFGKGRAEDTAELDM